MAYRGAQIFRPEIALARAQEFVQVDNKDSALQTLQEFLKARKHRQFTVHHPKIMTLYINLCVELRKSQIAKEGLYQYKALTQHQCPDELQKIIEYYLEQAAERAKKAKTDCKKAKTEGQETADLADIDDLDSCISPEALMLQAVTQASDTDRAERLHLTPWVKFLWDAYRQCLDIVKNNKILESLYREVAEKACKFCNKFTRTNEFRKLCDTMRQHLRQIVENNPSQANQIKSQNRSNHLILLCGREEQHMKSQEIQTEIRIMQLKTAIQMEVWQDAFKAIEDINTLQGHTQRIPKSYPNLARFKSKFMDQLSTVLMRAGQPLFHAATCHQIYFLNREMKSNIQKEKLMAMASQTLLATLSIPLTQKHDGLSRLLDMTNQVTEKNQRLAKLLNYERLPTRVQLVQDLKWRHVIRHVPRELASLFNCLELEFNPLRLAEKTEECLKWLKDSEQNPFHQILSPYVDKIQHVTASRVLQQVAQTYETIVFDRLLSLVPFYSAFQLEQHILDSCRTGALRAKIDHSDERTVSFGSTFDPAPLCVPLAADTNSIANENDWLNQHMNSIASALSKAAVVLRTDEQRYNRDIHFQQAAGFFRRTDDKIVDMHLNRKEIIEKFKDDADTERLNNQTKIAAAKQKAEEDRKAAEKLAIEKIVNEREKERKVQEDYELKLKFVRSKLEEMKLDDKLVQHVEFLEAEDLVQLGQDEADKVFQETIVEKQIVGVREKLINRKRSLGKREEEKDFFERAKRQEETRQRVESLPKRRAKLRSDVQKGHNLAVERSKAAHTEALSYKHKFAHMGAKILVFTADITKSAGEQYKIETKAFDEMKKQCVAEKKKQLKEEFIEGERLAAEEDLERAKAVIKSYEIEEDKRKREAERLEATRKQEEERKSRMEALQKEAAERAEREQAERDAQAEKHKEAPRPGPGRWAERNDDRPPQRNTQGSARPEMGGARDSFEHRRQRDTNDGGYERNNQRDIRQQNNRYGDDREDIRGGGWRGADRREQPRQDTSRQDPPRERGADVGGADDTWRRPAGREPPRAQADDRHRRRDDGGGQDSDRFRRRDDGPSDGPRRRFVGRAREEPSRDATNQDDGIRRRAPAQEDIRRPGANKETDGGAIRGGGWRAQPRDDGPKDDTRGPRRDDGFQRPAARGPGYGDRNDGPIRGSAAGADRPPLREDGPPRRAAAPRDNFERPAPRRFGGDRQDAPPRTMASGDREPAPASGGRWRPRGAPASQEQNADSQEPTKPVPTKATAEVEHTDEDGWTQVG